MLKKILLGFASALIALAIFVKCGSTNKKPENTEEGPVHEVYEEEPPTLEYGLPVDSFAIETAMIQRNQMLSKILMAEGISARTIDQIARMDSIFDVRKMRSGHTYKLFKSRDSLATLEYFVYEHTLTEYVMIQFKDSLAMYMGEKPTMLMKKMAGGTIESNLWDAMVENGINPMMSIELSEIYAWSIDFFGLQKGDQFFVIYEENFLNDSVSAGIEGIQAALFNHQNQDFYAIYFEQNSKGSYFDDEGNSLRRAFLKAPLKYSRISSRFSKNRLHPVLKIYRPHSGVDYAAPEGTPVYSVGDGFVLKKGYQQKGAGNYIKVKHNSVYTTQYAHLKAFARGLKQGDRVQQGQLIGYVGSTGYATGPHLDFRFFKNGEAVDPLKVDAPPVEPIQKINEEEYKRLKDTFIAQLEEQREMYNHPKDSTLLVALQN